MSEKEKQMKAVLEEIRNGKSRKEAAEIAGIPLYRIVHWYNEGKNGFGKDNIDFYKKLKKIEKNQIGNELINEDESFSTTKPKSKKIKKSKRSYYYKPQNSLKRENVEFKKYPQGNLKFLNVKAESDIYLSSRPHYLFKENYFNAEYFAIEYFKSKGYNAFFSENTSWKGLIRYLFKEILTKFKRFSKNKGYKSNYWDSEHFNFYKNEVNDKFSYYLNKKQFNKIVFKKLGNYRRKENILNICRNLEKEQILKVLYYIIQDYHHKHVGFPDIFVYNDNEAFFCEVKTRGDFLMASQVRAHEALLNAGIDVCYFSINKTDKLINEEKSKYFNEDFYDEDSYVEVYENKIKIANKVYEELKNNDIENIEKFFIDKYDKCVFLAFLNVINRLSLYNKILACQRLNDEVIDEALKEAEQLKNLYYLSNGYVFYEKGLYNEAIKNFIHVKTFEGYYLLNSCYRKNKDAKNEVKLIYECLNNAEYFSSEEIEYFKKRANSLDKNKKAISVYKTDKKCPNCGSEVILTELHKRNDIRIFKCSSSTCYWFGGFYDGNINYFTKYDNPSEYKTVNVDLSDFELDLSEMTPKEKRSLRSKLFRKAKKHQNNVELYEAIAFYERMLNHELFKDNYRPYKELSLLYRKTKQFDKDTEILTEFFKSEIKCKDTQLMWFKKRLNQLIKYGRLTKLEADQLKNEYETLNLC